MFWSIDCNRPRIGKSGASKLSAAAVLVAAIGLQACSTSRQESDGGSWKLWGSGSKPAESSSSRSQAGSGSTWKQPSNFDADGPPARTAEPAYRGGRDPVTGRAASADWPPAAPAPVQTTTLPPAHPYATPHNHSHPQAYTSAPGYKQQPPYPPQPGYAPSPVPMPASTPPSYDAAAPGSIAQPPYGGPRQAAGGPVSVEVRQGDTLYRIARTHNVSVPEIMQANALTNESIRPGQRLTIPVR